MEPVKTCVTCRHSLVARLHPADWFKRRLCGHPGMVDRVEGRPLNACDDARQAEQPCGIKGALWDGVEVVRVLPAPADIADPVDLAMRLRPRGRE